MCLTHEDSNTVQIKNKCHPPAPVFLISVDDKLKINFAWPKGNIIKHTIKIIQIWIPIKGSVHSQIYRTTPHFHFYRPLRLARFC